MLIEIHAIQNHSPANLNRDDLGAPKTCFFGGVLRSRISSQCLKHSIRMSKEFEHLRGTRTRRLAQLIAGSGPDSDEFKKAFPILEACGIAPKEKKKKKVEEEDSPAEDKSAGTVFVTKQAVKQMAELLKAGTGKSVKDLAKQFATIIAQQKYSPDMALCGRMLEPKKTKKSGAAEGEESEKPDVWKGLDPKVEAALQVAHAISTHEARPEVDYWVCADDVPGEDPGAAFLDEAVFGSACFYKYFSINWDALLKNLEGNEALAAHTVGAFLRGVALVVPSGKQNAYAAHNRPDGILVEIRDSPLSYANAFADPAAPQGGRDLVAQSIAQLGQYVHDIDAGYGRPTKRYWFSPNLRHRLAAQVKEVEEGKEKEIVREIELADKAIGTFDDLVAAVVKERGLDWEEVKKVVIDSEVA
jgi:CRISPR system Cascade subunit CasC